LIVAPGTMQKEYIEGQRTKHQKPFSLFFMCATIAALLYYWVNLTLLHHFNAGDANEASFFHQYWVILQIVMLPVYALITYAFFSKSPYNYAETLILILYNLSLILVVTGLLQVIKFIFPNFDTKVLEIPIILGYNAATNLKFYAGEKKGMIILKTVLSSGLCFYLAAIVQGILMDFNF
jgi:hypothetical protein